MEWAVCFSCKALDITRKNDIIKVGDLSLDLKKVEAKVKGEVINLTKKEFIKEYNKFQSGEYGSISVVQFARLQGIAVSTFYKYVSILKEK